MSDPVDDKLPWFPLWAADFTNSRNVRTMTPAQVGVFVLLLCSEWTDGPIPNDPELWGGLTNGAEHNDVITTLQRCFNETPTGWVNDRLERVRNDQMERRKRYSDAGKASAKARWGTKIQRRDSDVITTLQHPIASQSQKQIITTKRIPLPDEWEPTPEHLKSAKAKGLDVNREAEKFRNHAEANGRTMLKWNSAFATWLINAEAFAAQRNGGRRTPRIEDGGFIPLAKR